MTKSYYPIRRLLAIFLASCSLHTTTCPYDLYLTLRRVFTNKQFEQSLFYPFVSSVLHLFPADSPWLSEVVKLFQPIIPNSIKFQVANMIFPFPKEGKLLLKIITNSLTSPLQRWKTGYVLIDRGFIFYHNLDSYGGKGKKLMSVHFMKGFVLNENPDKLKLFLMQEEKQIILKCLPGSTLEEYQGWKNILQQHVDLFPTPSSLALSTGDEISF